MLTEHKVPQLLAQRPFVAEEAGNHCLKEPGRLQPRQLERMTSLRRNQRAIARRRSSPEVPFRSKSSSVRFDSGDRWVPSTAAILAIESRPSVKLPRIRPSRPWTINSPPERRRVDFAASVASAWVR
jgi:hypothetical protein